MDDIIQPSWQIFISWQKDIKIETWWFHNLEQHREIDYRSRHYLKLERKKTILMHTPLTPDEFAAKLTCSFLLVQYLKKLY